MDLRRYVIAAGLAGFSCLCSAYENFGPYVGAGVGQTNVAIAFTGATQPVRLDADDTAFKVLAGYRFSPYVGFELTYSDLGDFTYDVAGERLTLGFRGLTPYVIGSFPLGRFELLARLGYFVNTTEFAIESPNGNFSGSESNDSITYGAGVGVVVFKHFNIRLEYEVMELDDVDDADTTWLTVAWRFL